MEFVYPVLLDLTIQVLSSNRSKGSMIADTTPFYISLLTVVRDLFGCLRNGKLGDVPVVK
jgi:hypothetical protein